MKKNYRHSEHPTVKNGESRKNIYVRLKRKLFSKSGSGPLSGSEALRISIPIPISIPIATNRRY